MTESLTDRLRAANPVAERPAPPPIDDVIPGWTAEAQSESARRPSRRPGSRLLAAAVPAAAVVIAIVVVVVALRAIHGSPHSTVASSAPGASHHYASPEGWSLSYPAGFTLTKRPSVGGFTAEQVSLTNFAAAKSLAPRTPNGTPLTLTDTPYAVPLDAAGRFPNNGVALIIEPSEATFLGADSAFPISLSSFRPARNGSREVFFSAADYRRDGIPPASHHMIVFYSQVITATVLMGRKTSMAQRRELAAVVASLSIRRLSPGTHVAAAEVLGPAGRYAVGSFTLVHPHFPSISGPVYLVHAPGRLSYGQTCTDNGPCASAGTFYGMGGVYNTRRNHAPTCQLRLDRPQDDFYCANLGVRWDRVGRVISRPADESDIGSIEGLNAKVAWDGQVMISPGFGPTISRSAVHKLWPGWRQPNEPLSK